MDSILPLREINYGVKLGYQYMIRFFFFPFRYSYFDGLRGQRNTDITYNLYMSRNHVKLHIGHIFKNIVIIYYKKEV